jgi:MoaA/NifB/PqqE/SkfB family radical SAM enzyme
VRDSIDDQSYKYCKLDICPAVFKPTPFKVETALPKILKFSFDKSCNLECPSCRTHKIQYSKGSLQYKKSSIILDSIKQSYYKYGKYQDATFVITGSGDAFGGDAFRHFLYNFDGTKLPLLKFVFLTNGVMLTEKVVNKMKLIHRSIHQITISIDASTEKTYNTLRKGGNFSQLKKNIEYLHSCKELSHVKFCYSFVVQNSNFLEMNSFVNWITAYPRATVRFTRILPFPNTAMDFDKENIFDKTHPNHANFKDIINQIKGRPKIDYHNLQLANI